MRGGARPTDEQAMMLDTARAFTDARLRPNAAAWDRDGTLDRDTLRDLGRLGFGAPTVSEDAGGAGLGRLEAALLYEALAQGCVAHAAFLSIHGMVAWMIDRFGDTDQKARRLPALVGLERIASYCLTEPDAGSDAAALRTSARREGDAYVLVGAKAFISGAGFSDLYLVMARTGGPGAGGVSAFLVDRDAPGLSFGAPEAKMGWRAQPTAMVFLDGVRVPAADRLGAEGQGFRMAMAGLDGGRVSIAACALGGAQEAFERALAYTRTRRQFGRALAEMQATQFTLADMATDLAAARSLLHRAAQALDAGEPDATGLVAMAKRFATDAAFQVADRALQLHGGYGYLAAYEIERIVRDLRVHRILEGANEIMRVIVARRLLGGETG